MPPATQTQQRFGWKQREAILQTKQPLPLQRTQHAVQMLLHEPIPPMAKQTSLLPWPICQVVKRNCAKGADPMNWGFSMRQNVPHLPPITSRCWHELTWQE